ncbi:hypothetical protein B296_00004420, partial [Ensete ventricosum]
ALVTSSRKQRRLKGREGEEQQGLARKRKQGVVGEEDATKWMAGTARQLEGAETIALDPQAGRVNKAERVIKAATGRGGGKRAVAVQKVMTVGVAVGCNLRSHHKEKKGAAGSSKGYRRGGGLLAAAGGAVDAAGQHLVVAVGKWPRAGEGGGSGVSMRSTQQWLRLRAREGAVEATLEEEGRWWSAAGADFGEAKGDGRGCDQEGFRK